MLKITISDRTKEGLANIITLGTVIGLAIICGSSADYTIDKEEDIVEGFNNDDTDPFSWSHMYDYGDAVEIIMNSKMSNYYKGEAMRKLKKNQTPGYYKAIVNVVKSNTSDYYKIEAIDKVNR